MDKYFGAIRQSPNQGEWLDLNTISESLEFAKRLALQEDEESGPYWAKDHPVVRFAQLRVQEITSEGAL